MDKGFLEECLAQGMSLEAIGNGLGKHPSTVSYWLKRYGLTAAGKERHSPRGGLEKKLLETFVDEGLTLREIARRLDRSASTVRHWMDRYGLKTDRRRRAIPAGCPSRAQMRCQVHGVTEFVREGREYYRCVNCRAKAVAKRRRVVKRTLVEEAGGRCVICDYGRCQQALHFHHLDPATKKFNLGHQGQCRALDRSREEAKKCVLLCGNCHAEVEAGLSELPVDFQPEVNPV
jgi:transposase